MYVEVLLVLIPIVVLKSQNMIHESCPIGLALLAEFLLM